MGPAKSDFCTEGCDLPSLARKPSLLRTRATHVRQCRSKLRFPAAAQPTSRALRKAPAACLSARESASLHAPDAGFATYVNAYMDQQDHEPHPQFYVRSVPLYVRIFGESKRQKARVCSEVFSDDKVLEGLCSRPSSESFHAGRAICVMPAIFACRVLSDR